MNAKRPNDVNLQRSVRFADLLNRAPKLLFSSFQSLTGDNAPIDGEGRLRRNGIDFVSLRPMKDAVISDDPGELASEIVRVLTTDSVRREYERNAAAMVQREFDSAPAMMSLCRVLGLPFELLPGPVAAPTLA